MACNQKIKMTCGTKTYAPCVYYENEIPSFSPLSIEECVTIDETTEDLYNQVEKIKDEIGLSALGQQCLTYTASGDVLAVKDILLKYETEICTLKSKVTVLETTAICNKNITECGIDLSEIADNCDNPITTLGQLLQYLVTQSITP